MHLSPAAGSTRTQRPSISGLSSPAGARVNDQSPRTLGDAFLHVSKADALVEAAARAVLAIAALAWIAVLAGVLGTWSAAVTAGGLGLSVAGAITAANLALGFRRVARTGGASR